MERSLIGMFVPNEFRKMMQMIIECASQHDCDLSAGQGLLLHGKAK